MNAQRYEDNIITLTAKANALLATSYKGAQTNGMALMIELYETGSDIPDNYR